MWLDFKFNHQHRSLFAVCYQPPNSSAADGVLFLMCCCNVINDFFSDARTTILFAGDFNYHSMGKPFHEQTQVFRLYNMFNFHQVMQSPIRCAIFLIGLSLIPFA